MLQDCRDEKIFEEHGGALLKALCVRFRRENIQPLEPPNEAKTPASFWNLWGLLGSTKRSRTSEDGRPSKKRRVD
jgi:hypothetical protein